MTFVGNVGKDDRIIRALVGLGFISLVFVGPETAWGWFGIVPLLTAVIGFCPLNAKLGFDTSDKKVDGSDEEDKSANNSDNNSDLQTPTSGEGAA